MARTRYQAASTAIPLRELPAAALRAVLREGYTRADLQRDVLAGLVVGVVALPLAMALGVAVGVPPQHGLYTAIIAGFLVALLGGSRTQVSGPTAAFVVILAPIYTKHGLSGLLVSGLLAGFLLIGMALGRLGKLIQFIPHPVTTGFTAGIATVIAGLQLKDLLGLTLAHSPEHFVDRLVAMFEARSTATPWEPLIGFMTLAILVWFPRVTKQIPAPLVALPIAALSSVLLTQLVPGFHVATIASRFHTTVDGIVVSGVPRLPPLPVVPWLAAIPGELPQLFTFDTLRELVPGAFAIAMLGAIESLLSAVVADGMARTKHDPDSELLALGVGNIAASFFAGIPATGAIARTATNIRAGARSPIAALVHALTLLIVVIALAPALGALPMSALSALLLLVAWNMSEAKHLVHTLRVAPKSDVAVLLTCYSLTVVFDMVVGVAVGMVLAAFLFMRRMAEVTEARLASPERSDLSGPIPAGVLVYEISGPLFFGAAQKAMAALSVISDRSKAVILLMDDVHTMDATGLVALESALDSLKDQRCLAVLSNVQAQPLALLQKAHLDQREGLVLCGNAKDALTFAAAHIASHTSVPPISSAASRRIP